MDYIKHFQKIFDFAVATNEWSNMCSTTEKSPWHREESVAVHTEMVLDEYRTVVNNFWTLTDFCGALACLFHDFGKPPSLVVKYKPERGSYNAFHGHELVSARMWEDFVCTHWGELFEPINFTPAAVYRVALLIEHHLPYDIIDSQKRGALASTIAHQFTTHPVFVNVLKADTYGRVSDDHPQKIAKVTAWCDEFYPLQLAASSATKQTDQSDKKTVFVLIGPSGCGKSTFCDKIGDAEVYSWDALRLKWYPSDSEDPIERYKEAFDASCADSTFNNKAGAEFSRLIQQCKNKKSIIIDNTNISAKRRKEFIDSAHRNGYRAVAVLFPISLLKLYNRHSERGDKHVPWSAVKQHYMQVQLPLLGENQFDEILFSNGNLRINTQDETKTN